MEQLLTIVTVVLFLGLCFGGCWWAYGAPERRGYFAPHIVLVVLVGILLWLVIWSHVH